MAVPVQSKTVPQPARTEHLPQNSLGILPGAGDARQPSGGALPAVQGQAQHQPVSNNVQSQSAYATYHPAAKAVAKTAALHPLVAPALGGIAAVGLAAAGVQTLRKKRREHLDKLRDNMWKEDAKAQPALNISRPDNQYFYVG